MLKTKLSPHEKTQIIDSLSKHIYSLWELPKRSHLQDCNLNNYCLSSQQHPFCAVIVAKMLGLTAVMLSFISFTHCHTWIDQLSIIDSNNQPIGAPGFIRGYGMSSHPSTIAMLKPHQYNDFQVLQTPTIPTNYQASAKQPSKTPISFVNPHRLRVTRQTVPSLLHQVVVLLLFATWRMGTSQRHILSQRNLIQV